MQKGLILEGGAMRGLFSCGVTDVLDENDIVFDGAAGVSAGVTFGINFKSHQIGRARRYNERFCGHPKYGTFRSFFATGDIFDVDFCYNRIPWELDVFDADAFEKDPLKFYSVSTDLVTGKADYHLLTNGREKDLEYVRASASIPLLSRIVEVDGKKLLDGGPADAIPVRFMEGLGYDRNVAVLTRPIDYRKSKDAFLPLVRTRYRKYPEMIKTMATRHDRYNELTAYARRREAEGELFVIRPPEPVPAGSLEKDVHKLEATYIMGRETAEKALPALKEYLGIV